VQVAEKGNPPRPVDALHHCPPQYRELITRGLVNSFILQYLDQLSEATNTHQEDVRPQVPQSFLVKTVPEMVGDKLGCMLDVFFNLDNVAYLNEKVRKQGRSPSDQQ
jgi:hypothetical protein